MERPFHRPPPWARESIPLSITLLSASMVMMRASDAGELISLLRTKEIVRQAHQAEGGPIVHHGLDDSPRPPEGDPITRKAELH